MNVPPSDEPQVRDLVRLLDPDGEPSGTHTRVKTVVSYDRHEDCWEIIDSWNQTRIITHATPNEWLEVDL